MPENGEVEEVFTGSKASPLPVLSVCIARSPDPLGHCCERLWKAESPQGECEDQAFGTWTIDLENSRLFFVDFIEMVFLTYITPTHSGMWFATTAKTPSVSHPRYSVLPRTVPLRLLFFRTLRKMCADY